MQTQNLMRALLALALAAGISACKGKVTAQDNSGPKTPVFADAVKGPELDGEWQGHCVEDGWGAGYAIFHYSLQGRNIQRTETKYTDVQCTTQESELTQAGQFRYMQSFASGAYSVEYKIQIPNGSYLLQENIKPIGDSLWISDRVTGEGVDPDIELIRVPPVPPVPPANP
jgi:hypothetical protein